ncbi:MAG: DUF3298 and DUF4163 domain-containing protein [Fimbriimonadales bacterium]|nr:DUF3298 and DUF4163 domain-containing protein [Fimbriimonadales bacterium]
MRTGTLLALAAMLLSVACSQSLKVSYRAERQNQGDFYSIDLRIPSFPAEQPVGALANREVEMIVQRFKRDFLQAMQENRKLNFRTGAPFQLQIRATISIARANLVSLYLEIFQWTGGAHPNTYYRVVNVGLVNGKPRVLKLQDLLTQGASAQEVMTRVYQRLEEVKRQRDPSGEPFMPEGGVPREYWNSFILTPTAIVWVFEPYAVGAYAEGKFLIRLSYNELQGLVRRF